jgi:hypothetical protein
MWIIAALVACGPRGGGGSDTATFHVAYPDATTARTKVGARFYAKPAARCVREDGSDARWAIVGAHVTSGELPPGITIEDGALTGTPTKAGEYAATVSIGGVTCAGKPYPDQVADVHITVHPR